MQPEGFDDALGASYSLLDRLGEGATGEVWRAVHRPSGDTVATKLLRREHLADRELVGRFVQERSVLVGLRHPAIVAVRDLVVEGDRLAIVMEHVSGGSLREVLRERGTLPPALAVDVVAAVLDGLAAAHAAGVVHRDVKPDNVLLAESWTEVAPGQVKLVDFGIARIITDRAATTTGLLGTPEYMSPELLTRGTADAAADVYGAGILLYELLAGRTPFAGPGTEYTVAHRHVSAAAPALDVPDRLGEVLEALLQKDPSARPTAARAAAILRAARAELVDVPALVPQPAPDDFDPARGPLTLVRGMPGAPPTPPPDTGPATGAATDTDPGDEALPDLGAGGPQTLVRPMRRTPVHAQPRTAAERDRPRPGRPGWQDPRLIAVVAVALLLIVAAVLWVTRDGGTAEPGAEPAGAAADPAPAPASLTGSPLPTGLTVSRTAVYDPESGTAELTLTYAAQRAPLTGPFLEVVPGVAGECAAVQWQDADQRENVPTVTGITADCGWSVDVGTIEPQTSTSVTAQVALSFEDGDAGSGLQAWVGTLADATDAALLDTELSSTSYPVQRLQTVQVEAQDRTVSSTTLPLVLLPVWPDGVDRLNPLYRSPSTGRPSEMLVAVAGGEGGVRFSSGCSSSIAVTGDGLTVTALSPTPECQVDAQVGNFTDLRSNSFAVVTRGG